MSDFDDFFYRATKYHRFPYQKRLAEDPEFSEFLQVPTGTGKTAAAVLAWVWRRQKRPGETPRRLVYCLPMRVLVGQTRASSVMWLHRLGLLAGQAELDESEEQVVAYQPSWGEAGKITVATLMGGDTDDQWREHPERDLLLIGTQDMLMSRALNRGYAAWPQDWPVDFGLLNVDTLWVMDEVQLMGPARTTSSQLQLYADYQARLCAHEPLAPRRTLWMSATLGVAAGSHEAPAWMKTPEWSDCLLRVPVAGACDHGSDEENDLAPGGEFSKRWTAPKQLDLRLHQVDADSSKAKRRPAKTTQDQHSTAWTIDSPDLANCILRESTSSPGRTVLVFVNRVDRARALFDKLRTQSENPDDLILLHARFRPQDRRAAERRLTDSAPPSGRIVVSTQVLEAGVDLDSQALFTEVCPWPSLVQRLGRLNRRGEQKSAPAIVFDVPFLPQKEKEPAAEYHERAGKESSRPYDVKDIEVTRARLATISAAGGSLSPETLSKLQARVDLVGPVLRRFDLDDLFDTDPDLAGGHTDVAAFVRALDRDVDAYVLWRRLKLPPDAQPPMHADELCPAPFYEVRDAFAGQDVWILTLATSERRGAAKRRGAAWRRAQADEVRAGDTVMVDLGAGCYTEEAGWLGKGHATRRPGTWIDRWDRADGVAFRAWARTAPSSGGVVFTDLDIIDTRVDASRASGEDPRSYSKRWMELDLHMNEAKKYATAIVTSLNLPANLANPVCTAARWHDVGKALERELEGDTLLPFQNMLLKAGVAEDGAPRPGVLYAKSNRRGGPPSGFRHEVASVLAYLAQPDADELVAYLVMAHHGKVRLLPTPWDDDDSGDVNGVRPNDRVPGTVLPDTGSDEPVHLDPARLLSSPLHPGWQGRVARLVQRLGPFGLAYLEALVRVADWRAS
jgi:CRISPR-associated endonuclease/helicase Cas3